MIKRKAISLAHTLTRSIVPVPSIIRGVQCLALTMSDYANAQHDPYPLTDSQQDLGSSFLSVHDLTSQPYGSFSPEHSTSPSSADGQGVSFPFGSSSPGSQFNGSVESLVAPASLSGSEGELAQSFRSNCSMSLQAPHDWAEKIGFAASTGAAAAESSKKGGKNRSNSHAKRKPEGHIPRPRNAFIIFRCYLVAEKMVPSNFANNHRNISRIVSNMWNRLSDVDRQSWQEAARQEKAEHQRLYPQYKYKPVSKSRSKSHSKKRSVPESMSVIQKCEEAADALFERYGDDTCVKVEDEMPRSRQSLTKRWRQERTARAPRPKARARPVVRLDAPPPHIKASDVIDRKMAIAGDLATSAGLELVPLTQVLPAQNTRCNLFQQRRPSSLPPLGDGNVGLVPASIHLADNYQAPETNLYNSTGHGWAMPHLNPYVNATPSTSMSSSYPGESAMGPPSGRKGPPPPIGLGPMGSHITRIRGLDMTLAEPPSPRGYVPHNAMHDFWQNRPKTMASSTPRTAVFQITPRATHNEFQNEFSVVSPMRSSFSGYRRPSAAWQSWSRTSGVGISSGFVDDDGTGAHSLSDLTPRAGKTQFGNVGMPYASMDQSDDDVFQFSPPTRPTTDSGSVATSSDRGHGHLVPSPAASHPDVFAFGSDFLGSTTSNMASLRSSTSSSLGEDSQLEAILATEIIRSAPTSPHTGPQLQTPPPPMEFGPSAFPLTSGSLPLSFGPAAGMPWLQSNAESDLLAKNGSLRQAMSFDHQSGSGLEGVIDSGIPAPDSNAQEYVLRGVPSHAAKRT